jgi:hypothetical protein
MATVEFPAFQWRTMTSAINQIPKAPMMLQDLVFKNRNVNPSDVVDVDVMIGGRKILPFVSRHAPGTVVEKMSGEMRSVKTPRIRAKKPFSAVELLTKRSAGTHFYGTGVDINAAREAKVGQELLDLRNRVDITIEFMCAQALTGGYTVTNDGHVFSIDFNMPAAHKPVNGAGTGWNETTGDILDDIDTWSQLISDAVGMGPTIGLCGKNVVKAIRDDSKTAALLDNRRTLVGNLEWNANNNFIGDLNGIKLYRNGNTYTDSEGNTSKFIGDDIFVLIAPEARYSIEFGPIMDLDIGANVMSEFFSKSWLEKDPSALWMLAESSPLPVLWQPEAIVYADVIV